MKYLEMWIIYFLLVENNIDFEIDFNSKYKPGNIILYDHTSKNYKILILNFKKDFHSKKKKIYYFR